MADFFGPNLPPPFPAGLISIAEYTEVVTAYPREGLKDEIVQIFCGLCREKPGTTFDNFASDFGMTFGLDGKGSGKEEFAKKVEAHKVLPMLFGALEKCQEVDPKVELSKPRQGRDKYWYEAE